jgi:hypothetical protein
MGINEFGSDWLSRISNPEKNDFEEGEIDMSSIRANGGGVVWSSSRNPSRACCSPLISISTPLEVFQTFPVSLYVFASL